jgi:RNA polymerase sigma-70 factor (ECF subfamily)
VAREGPDWGEVQARLLAGDRLAFLEVNRLISAFLARFRAYDFREEWEDLRQEVVFSVIANARAGRLRDPGAFAAYVRSITRNKLVDRLKQRLRRHEGDTLPWDEASERLAADPPVADGHDLHAALHELPDEERRAVAGVYLEGRTYQEVADATGLPLGTLKRRLRDGLAALRIRLGTPDGIR